MVIDWTKIVTIVLESLVIPAIYWVCREAVIFFKSKTKNEKVKSYIDRVGEIVKAAVAATNQTFVEGIKGTEEWNEEAMKKAFNMSMATALDVIGEQGLALLGDMFGDVNTYLKARIEAAVNELKSK